MQQPNLNFSETEKKLSEIWKNVLFMSAQKYDTLNKSSDFFDFTGWGSTLKLASLTGKIKDAFKISTEPFSLGEYSILSEQAALIDRIILHKETILFLTSWIKEVFSSSTISSIKEAKLKQIPAEDQANLRELFAQSDWDTVLISDFKFDSVEISSLLDISIPVELGVNKGAALITKHKLNLLFILETLEREPKILSLKHSAN
jgi:hypothetical protein